ncbi:MULTISPECIES: hypothetical protein [unclassified Adlercreutzia]|uniref:hypothetical protein n=1 Tax=unclassified Adlercreutzia TaxID=2636013 RepID=UPI0013EDE911|nr:MULTISPECIES: hypothetical protein [unclassified Adlercreutzia]
MGLFDRKRKATDAVDVRVAGSQERDGQASDSQLADAPSVAVLPEPEVRPEADAEPSTTLPVVEAWASDAPTAETQAGDVPPVDALSAPKMQPTAEWSDADRLVQPAAKWSDGGQPADLATEQAMTAPSLENVIVTKSRDLSRLSREDLLQLLLTQSKDAERLQDYLRDVADEFERCTSLNARLREKLDAKDEQIERLKGRLDDKDKRIALMQARLDELEVSKEEEQRHARIITNAAKGVRSALEAFNATADWYIASLQEVCGDLDGQPARSAATTSPERERDAATWAAAGGSQEAETLAQAADGSQNQDEPSPVSPAPPAGESRAGNSSKAADA